MISVFDILLANGSFWIPLLFGLLFLCLPQPNKKIAGDYKIIKYYLSSIYLLDAFISLFALLFNKELNFDVTIRLFVPLIAVFHIILFSHVNILLINKPNFKSTSLIPILATCTILSTIYLFTFFNQSYNQYLKNTAIMMYILLFVLTIFYTYHFFTFYKKFNIALDNYYSNPTARHLMWVQISQIIVILSAIFVFSSNLMPDYSMIAFMGITLIFCIYYAIRLIRYYYSNEYIEAAYENFHKQEKDDTNDNEKPLSISFSELEESIAGWVAEKKYLNTDTTIINVANELNTNRTYLSQYINNYKNQSFKEWISDLKIEEAKRLLSLDQKQSIGEISINVGFTDKSNFSRVFSKVTGKTPSAWRKEYFKNKKIDQFE